MARRDSILKHAGSVKNTDRRVSINQPIIVEYMSEKRPSGQQSSAATMQQSSSSSSNYSSNKSNPRPASLVFIKNDRPTVKLIRTPSFDQDQDDATATNTPNTIATHYTGNVRAVHPTSTHLARDDDDDADESIPLVQPSDKESNNKISNSINYT